MICPDCSKKNKAIPLYVSATVKMDAVNQRTLYCPECGNKFMAHEEIVRRVRPRAGLSNESFAPKETAL